MDNKFSVVPFGDGRYAIESGGAIVDDAQGYGFKSQSAAYKFMYYKANRKLIKRENKIVESFMCVNKSFSDMVCDMIFERCCAGEKLTSIDLIVIADKCGLKFPMEAGKFLDVLNRKSCRW